MDELLDYNKSELFKKLDALKKIEELYPANDLIDIVSTNKERDKRLINEYTPDELVVRKTIRGGYTREVRFFTHTGISRYITEGKIFSLKNVCEYFKIPYKDPAEEKIKESLAKIKKINGKYKTSMILKWLFDKRKSCKELSEYIDLPTVIEFAETHNADSDKITMLKNM